MARPKKRPVLTHCKVVLTAHSSPWRVWYDTEDDTGKKSRASKRFSDEDAAWAFAEEKDLEISNHGARFGDIPPEARRCFDAYRDRVSELADKGITLPPFEELVADAIRRIVADHEAAQKQRTTVADAVDAFNAYKKTRVGDRQAQDYRTRTKRFALTFGTTPVDEITADGVESWLDGLRSRQEQPLGTISRNNLRTTITTFLEFCRKRGWCAANVMDDVEREKVTEKELLAYSPDETRKILLAALAMKSPALPSLALGFFSGLRVSETLHINLGRIDLASTEFRVSVSKTGPRMAPLLPAGAAWLAACPRTGMAWDGSIYDLMREVRKVREAAKIRRIANGPRHSFITYRAAVIRDVGRVADECGNSAQMVADNYRAIVPESVGIAYFDDIRPPAECGEIIELKRA